MTIPFRKIAGALGAALVFAAPVVASRYHLPAEAETAILDLGAVLAYYGKSHDQASHSAETPEPPKP